MSRDRFEALVGQIAEDIADRPLDAGLADRLNAAGTSDGAIEFTGR